MSGIEGPARVVRVDRGAVLVLPVGTAGGIAGTIDPGAEPVRVALDHDGTAPYDNVRHDNAPGAPDGGGVVRDGASGGADGAGVGSERVTPTVGDLVELATRPDGTPTIVAVRPRRTAVVRDSVGGTSRTQALAASVDLVLVVEHLDPDPRRGRVERLLALAWQSGATPVVVLTKADLVPDPEGMTAEIQEVAVGVAVHAVSVVDGTGLDAVRALLAAGTTVVVLGPSGAGKSTLVNALAGTDVMATGARRSDGAGRHTTSHRELVPLPSGAMLIDTPGLRGVGVVADPGALGSTFPDVTALAEECRFADCAHVSEPGCAVRAAIEDGDLDERRFVSWQRLAREAEHQARRADSRLAAEQRARTRRQTVAYHRQLRGRPGGSEGYP